MVRPLPPASEGLIWEVQYVHLTDFLIYLANGWTFPRCIAEPIQSHGVHGYYSCLMERYY